MNPTANMEISNVPNPALDLSALPRIEDVEFHQVSKKYRAMRLALWGSVQFLYSCACLTPYLLYKVGGDQDMAQFSGWYWPLGAGAAFGLLWFLEEWKGFPKRVLCGNFLILLFAHRQEDPGLRLPQFSRDNISRLTLRSIKTRHTRAQRSMRVKLAAG